MVGPELRDLPVPSMTDLLMWQPGKNIQQPPSPTSWACGQIPALPSGAPCSANPMVCRWVCFGGGGSGDGDGVCSPYSRDRFLLSVTWVVARTGDREVEAACVGELGTRQTPGSLLP